MTLQLQKHQNETVDYLSEKCVNQHGLLLYHNMGTGKTLTALSIIFKNITKKRIKNEDILIICPDTIQSTWILESQKLNLNLRNEFFMNYEQLNDLVITGKKNKDLLKDKFIVLDECHHIIPYFKSDTFKNYFLFLEIFNKTKHILLLTGTPFYYSENGTQSDISYLLNVCEGNKNDFPILEEDWKKRYMDHDLIEKRKKSFYFNWIRPSIYLGNKITTFSMIVPIGISYLVANMGMLNVDLRYQIGSLTKEILNLLNINILNNMDDKSAGWIGIGAIYVLIYLFFYITTKISIWTDTGSGDVNRAINLMRLDYQKLGSEAGRYVSYFKNEIKDPNFATIKYQKHFESSYTSFQAELCFKLYFNVLDSKYKYFITEFTKKEEIVKGNILKNKEGTLKYSVCIGNFSSYIRQIIDNNLEFKINPDNGTVSVPLLDSEEIKSQTCNKFIQLKNHILKNKDKRIVISSQFTKQGAYLLSLYLNTMGIPHLYLNGNLTMEQKLKILSLFNNDKFNIIIIDKSASEGISLLRVSEIHLLEPVSNLSLRDQMIARGVRYKSHEGIDDPEVSVFTHVSVMMLNSTQINDFKKRVANGTINMGKTLMYSAKLKEVFDSNLRGLIPRTNWRVIDALINPIQVLCSTGLASKPNLPYRVTPDNVAIDIINIQKVSDNKLSEALIKENILTPHYFIPTDCINSKKKQGHRILSSKKSLSLKRNKSLKTKSLLKKITHSQKKTR